jgi:hypothetical protein
MTTAEAQAHLDAWTAADTAISTGKAYTIGNRALTRADAEEVKTQITYWQRAVNTLTAAGNGVTNPGVRIATWK